MRLTIPFGTLEAAPKLSSEEQSFLIACILRHNGVDIGKMDFLGPINWIDA